MTSSQSEIKGRFQMNCCLVCNKTFCTDKTFTVEDGKVKVANLCKILQVSFDEEHFEPEINPICSHCTMMTNKYFTIEKQVQSLILTLGKLKEMLAKKVVVSFKAARPSRKNAHMKKIIYDVWVSKLHVSKENIDHPSIQTEGAGENPAIIEALSEPSEPHDEGSICTQLDSPDHDNRDYSDDNDKDEEIVNIKPNQPVNALDKENDLESPTVSSENQKHGNNQHNHRRSGSKPFPKVQLGRQQHCCRTCSKIFPTLYSLNMHERLHTGEKPFECSVCSRRFNVKCNRDKHEKTHDLSRKQGEPEFACDLCGKKYHLKDSLLCHKRQHALGKVRLPSSKPKVTKPKKASLKGEGSRRKKESNRRTEKDNELKTELPDILDDCNDDDDHDHTSNEISEDADREINRGASKKRRLTLQRRLVKKAKSSKIKVKVIIRKGRPRKNKTCMDCDRTFPTAYALMLHMRIHTDEKPHQCEICLRTFRRPESKIKHMATHKENRFQGQKSHICDICGKEFYLQHSLYQHRRHVHLGIPKSKSDEKSLTCAVCGKLLSRPGKLKEHMIRHTDRKKFPCSVCQKPFYTPSEAKNHANNYHNPKKLHLLFKHKCPACPPEYIGLPSKKAVKQHWLEFHSNLPVPEEYNCLKSKSVKNSKILECEYCPEGIRPVYKYKETYQRHYKKFHADGTGKGGKTNRPYQLTRRNIRALEMGKKSSRRKNDDDESMESYSTTCSEGVNDDSRNVSIKRSQRSRKCREPIISKNRTKELRIMLQKIEQDDLACEKYYILQEFKKNI